MVGLRGLNIFVCQDQDCNQDRNRGRDWGWDQDEDGFSIKVPSFLKCWFFLNC